MKKIIGLFVIMSLSFSVFASQLKHGVYVGGSIVAMRTKIYNHHFVSGITDINETDLLPVAGGSVDYYFTKHFAMGFTASYMFSKNNTPHVATYGLRTSYTF